MQIIDGRKNLPVMLERKILQSKNLSWQAKGIYADIMSKEPSVVTLEELYKPQHETKEEIDSAIQELIEIGFLDGGIQE